MFQQSVLGLKAPLKKFGLKLIKIFPFQKYQLYLLVKMSSLFLIFNSSQNIIVILCWIKSVEVKEKHWTKKVKCLLRQCSSMQLVSIWKLQAEAVLKCRLQGGQLPSCLWLYQCWHLTLAAILELNPPLKKRREGHIFPLCLWTLTKTIWYLKRGNEKISALYGGCCSGGKKTNNIKYTVYPC